ncbi:hypothetical protein H2248_012087 [Termitomyces sp. 'cryptogamus']|nr:hypothetical protein H2248_012087 [Termitomyces sp. 'cryptogamus']
MRSFVPADSILDSGSCSALPRLAFSVLLRYVLFRSLRMAWHGMNEILCLDSSSPPHSSHALTHSRTPTRTRTHDYDVTHPKSSPNSRGSFPFHRVYIYLDSTSTHSRPAYTSASSHSSSTHPPHPPTATTLGSSLLSFPFYTQIHQRIEVEGW